MARTLNEAKQGGKTPTATQNGNKTQINNQIVVKAISELYNERGDEIGTMYSVNEILTHLGVKVTDSDGNYTDKGIESARAFVKATNSVHTEPNRFLGDTPYYDIYRRAISEGEVDYVDSDAFSESNYFNWHFGLLKAKQIGDAIEQSGFEGRTSHEVGNRVNSERWGNYLPGDKLTDAKKAKLKSLGYEVQ